MRLDVTHHIAPEDRRLLQAFLDRHSEILAAINRLEKNMNARTQAELDKLTEITDVVKAIAAARSAIDAHVADLETQLAAAKANATDPTDFDAVDTSLQNLKDLVAGIPAATTANTDADANA